MIASVRHWIKQRLRSLGVDIRRLHVASDPGLQLQQAMAHFGIELVLDVGANRGQFVKELRANGYRGRMVSFEPLSQAHRELAKAAEQDPAWTVHERVALGASEGRIELNIAANSVSSSVLEMLDLHREAAPGTGYIGKEEAPLRRLDVIARPYMHSPTPTLLKIDVQGLTPGAGWRLGDFPRHTRHPMRTVADAALRGRGIMAANDRSAGSEWVHALGDLPGVHGSPHWAHPSA